MASGVGNKKYQYGRLTEVDNLGPKDRTELGSAIASFSEYQNKHATTQHWGRTLVNVENILFSSGRHYQDGIVGGKIHNSSPTGVGTLTEVRDTLRNIPRPTNDILGRYIEPNISLLTENQPRPRVTAKSDRAEDGNAAELSELTLEYLWEALKLPRKHRELARIVIHCGVAWLEVFYDRGKIRRMKVPQTREEEEFTMNLPGGGSLRVPVARQVPVVDERGRPVYTADKEFGDVVANIVSPFELHFSDEHWWEDIEWTLKEEFMPMEVFRSRYADYARARGFTKRNGWSLEEIDKVGGVSVHTLPIWWWERISRIIEGSGPNFNIGTEDQWNDHVIIRTYDRKPSEKWPNGRTVIVANNVVIYDSPKAVGARVYDARWPERWHPYIRYCWEGMVGNIYGRSLVSKLLPKIKRINTIDTAMIMWRRTIPYAGWLMPNGAEPVEGFWTGGTGRLLSYDVSRTQGHKPEPIYPPPFPESVFREREMQIQEMDMIAGTEEVLRGARPVGTTSSSMLAILRKQVLASRSPIIQQWDESQQELGTALLQETIKHVREDPRYLERIRVLAREKHSRLSIETFSGEDLSDNVHVRVDTASLALASKEAREAKTLEFLQYAPSLMALPMGLRQAVVEELGFAKGLTPQGPDVQRAKRMIGFIRQNQFDRLIPLPDDDPYVFVTMLVDELKSDSMWDYSQEQLQALLTLIEDYKRQIQIREEQLMRIQVMMAQAGQRPGAQGGEQQQGAQ